MTATATPQPLAAPVRNPASAGAMSTPAQRTEIIYPESDGKPMADNTKQFRYIVTIQGGIAALFADNRCLCRRRSALVSGEGNNKIRAAPDTLVVFGRPPGDRGSYLQWREDGLAPQVVFEVLSPGNTVTEMARKFSFYERYGVDEYYLYDPDRGDLLGWIRRDGRLEEVPEMEGWISPRLGVRFSLEGSELVLYRPDGWRFETFLELEQRAEAERQRAEAERQRAEGRTPARRTTRRAVAGAGRRSRYLGNGLKQSDEEITMSEKLIDRTPSAYAYPLLIKNLLGNPVRQFPDQEIVYGDFKRQTYRDLGERVGRLASGLAGLGVKPGDTVAVMDWDSHRYLECFFAVPMMGAVLHTVNIRLSPEQILYTINHAEDDVILVNTEFLPILETIRDRIEPVKKLVLLNDTDHTLATTLDIGAEYEALLAASDPNYHFPDFAEDARATTFYTTGTTGLPKGVYFSHRQLVLHTFGVLSALAGTGQGRFNRDDVYMPITPMFHVHAWGVPYVAPCWA